MKRDEKLLRVSILALLLMATACTSMRTVDHSSAESERPVAVGDTARIVTRDGQEIEITVTAVEKDALVGWRTKKAGRPASGFEIDSASKASTEETLRVPFDQVATVQVQALDGWKTAALVGGTVAGFWLIGLLLASLLVVPVM